MKKPLLLTFLGLFTCFALYAQNVTIPDANFKANLVGNAAINTNSDSEIQVSEAVAFTGTISCALANITSITGIEAFTNLTRLYCYSNPGLTTIDVSSNPDLEYLMCSGTAITSLDLSSNPNLLFLSCDGNPQLAALNVANGNNTIIVNSYFYANNNPSLNCIQVDDAAWSTTNWTNIDAGTNFSVNCSDCIVNIPDANFKAYLVGEPTINTNADSEIQCNEATAFSGDIYCPNQNISDLTGIEAFTNLTGLYCNNNQLTSLNTSANTNLIMLYTQNNLLTSLNVSGNTSLTDLNCTVNNLTALDLTSLTALEWLDCSVNQLTALDLSMNPSMDQLFCYSNNLTALDLSNNALLYDVNCAVNQITSLDLSNNTALLSINCAGNQLQQLDLSSNTALTTVTCQLNQLTSLDLSGNPALLTVQCQNNALTALNIANGQNTNLVVLFAQANPGLTCIQVDDATYSNTNWVNTNYQHDVAASYNEDCGLGLENNKLILSLYPNPVNHILYFESNTNTVVQIVNAVGETLQIRDVVKGINAFDLSTLSSGIYLLKTESSADLKFVKQ